MLNHFEFHSEISDKFKLAINFKAYCDVSKIYNKEKQNKYI